MTLRFRPVVCFSVPTNPLLLGSHVCRPDKRKIKMMILKIDEISIVITFELMFEIVNFTIAKKKSNVDFDRFSVFQNKDINGEIR
jgi:hypothetical protein